VAFGQLQEEVSGVSDEAPAGLEQPLLEARQRPALDGGRQDKPTQEIAEVVGDDAQERPDLVGPEPMTGKRVQLVAALPSLIHCSPSGGG